MDLVFAVNAQTNRMQSFRSDTTIVKQWGSLGSADGKFSGLAVLAQSQDPTRNCIFVADSWNHRIQVFDVEGSFVHKWGSQCKGDGQFCYPCGIAVLARSQDGSYPTQDLVFVADSDNQRIQVFGSNGTFIRKWGSEGEGDGQFKFPYGVAVHPTRDLIFISDGHRIQAFRSDGAFLYQWGSKGSADSQFSFPHHLAIHPTRNLLFVVDCCNHRVQVFALDGFFVCKWGIVGNLTENSISHRVSRYIPPMTKYTSVMITKFKYFRCFEMGENVKEIKFFEIIKNFRNIEIDLNVCKISPVTGLSDSGLSTMESRIQSFLLPLCQARGCVNTLENVGTNPIFDRNVIGLVAQFAVIWINFLSSDIHLLF